ncbi:pentapeptide repeat-containing protein [Ruminococcus flavefaciens]|uniref:pentapeptide repeat-containing protein n=1 Tax=Ruminococcus flavefaciens TaxID=1265 RepID=UPI00048C3217|nr:pentapeptide repeat-containing protein [Ruminococcus flavefaciens]
MDRAELIKLLEEYTQNEKMSDLTITDETISDMDFSSYYLGLTWFMGNQFDSCIFHTTRLTDTNFNCSVFRNCKFSENYILKADWNNVKFIYCSIVSIEAVRVSFLSIIMEDCEVKNSEFFSCYFNPVHKEGQEEGHLSKTVFRNCAFNNCSFEDCTFDSVEFIGCKFTNTDIDTTNPGVHFKDCEFKTVPYK